MEPKAFGFPKSTKLFIFNPKTKIGVTIHYKGKLDTVENIDSFCEEIEDIAKSMGWKFNSFDFDEKDKTPAKGLFIGPHPNAEMLQLMFDKNGFLRNALIFEHFPPADEITYLNHTKTQFAPVGIHVAIIKLLKYIQQKYISNLDVYDEGEYWQTGDEKILKGKIDFLNKAIDRLEGILNSIKFEENETADSVADKIEEVLKNMKFRKP